MKYYCLVVNFKCQLSQARYNNQGWQWLQLISPYLYWFSPLQFFSTSNHYWNKKYYSLASLAARCVYMAKFWLETHQQKLAESIFKGRVHSISFHLPPCWLKCGCGHSKMSQNHKLRMDKTIIQKVPHKFRMLLNLHWSIYNWTLWYDRDKFLFCKPMGFGCHCSSKINHAISR